MAALSRSMTPPDSATRSEGVAEVSDWAQSLGQVRGKGDVETHKA